MPITIDGVKRKYQKRQQQQGQSNDSNPEGPKRNKLVKYLVIAGAAAVLFVGYKKFMKPKSVDVANEIESTDIPTTEG